MKRRWLMRRALPMLLLLAGSPILLLAQSSGPQALSLDQALELALPASDAVGLARADTHRADGEVKRVRADYLPQLTGTASYIRTLESQFGSSSGSGASSGPSFCNSYTAHPSLTLQERVDSLESAVACYSALNPLAGLANLPFGRTNQYNFGLQFTQTLFSSGIVNGRPRAAVAGRRVAQLGLSQAEAQARLQVTEAYFDAVLSERLSGIAELSLAQAESTLADTRAGNQVGTRPEFDLLRAQVTVDNQRSQVFQRRAQRELARMQLLQLIGLPVATAVELTTTLDETPAGGVMDADSLSVAAADTAVGSRAAVQQAEAAVTIQQVLTGVTRWDRLPTVTLKSTFARIGYPDNGVAWQADYLSDWTIGVHVSVPLWTSGRLSGNSIVSEAALTQARIRAEQARDGAAFDARAAVLRLRTAQASWAATQRTVEQAERAYQIATLRYQEGISTQTELADARLLLEQAQANRATAARDAHVARTRLQLLQDLPLAGADVAQTLSNAASGQQAIQQPAASGTSGSTP